MHQPAGKETLAHWVSLALMKALSHKNITKGFTSIGIMPLNHIAVDGQFASSRAFETAADKGRVIIEGDMDERACEDGAGGERATGEGTSP